MNEPLTVQEAPAIYQVMLDTPRIKQGYKQTEVGVIPEDWEASEVGTLNPFVTSGSRGWANFYSELGSPFIRITNMSRDSIYLDLANLKQVKLPVHANEGKRTQLQNDDVLISITADIGIASFVDDSVTKPAYINQHIALVRFNANDVNSKFITYFLASESAQRRFLSSTDQGAKAGMTLGGIKKIQLALPPENEQLAIATALSDVDALLAAQDKLIAKKRDIKQAAMQQLLTGKQRLPGFTGEWEVKRLGDICGCITTGKLDANAMVASGEYPFFTCAREHYFIDEYAFDADALLVSGNGANVGYVHHYTGKFNAYQRTYVLTDFNAEIVYLRLFMDRNLQERLRTEVNAGNTPYITMDTLTDMTVALPSSREEQTAIATILSDIDADLAALEQQRDKTRALKQGMMQELLTGRIRLV